MGSGGSHLLLPPGKPFTDSRRSIQKGIGYEVAFASPKLLGCYMVKPHGQLVLVSFTHYCASTPSLSTL